MQISCYFILMAGKISTLCTCLFQKWRKRYFVLSTVPSPSHAHDTAQYLLCYYTDSNKKRKKGSIDLSQCDEVQSLLHNQDYRNLFSIKTRDRRSIRTYFLSADNNDDMLKWVDCLCDVLGMKEDGMYFIIWSNLMLYLIYVLASYYYYKYLNETNITLHSIYTIVIWELYSNSNYISLHLNFKNNPLSETLF